MTFSVFWRNVGAVIQHDRDYRMEKQFNPLDLFDGSSGEYWDGRTRHIIENGKVVRTEHYDELRTIDAGFTEPPNDA